MRTARGCRSRIRSSFPRRAAPATGAGRRATTGSSTEPASRIFRGTAWSTGGFSRTWKLQARFGADGGTVSGCINCDGRATVVGEYYEYDAASRRYLDEIHVYESAPIAMAFHDSAIGVSGEFSSNLSAVGAAGTAPEGFSVSGSLVQGFRVSGTWGGILSRNMSSEGVPDGIVATFGAEASHPGGTRAGFAGFVNSELDDSDMNVLGPWARITDDGGVNVGIRHAGHNLFARYNTGFVSPTLSPSGSFDAQPGGQATWLGEWSGVYGDRLEYSDDGEARVDVAISGRQRRGDPHLQRHRHSARSPTRSGRLRLGSRRAGSLPSATITVAGTAVYVRRAQGQFGGDRSAGGRGPCRRPGLPLRLLGRQAVGRGSALRHPAWRISSSAQDLLATSAWPAGSSRHDAAQCGAEVQGTAPG